MKARRLQLALVLASLTYNVSASANTFNLHADGPTQDPAENFDEECLGDTTQEDCDLRAAMLEANLVDLLISLEWDDSAETVALFREALTVDSTPVQTLALQYMSRLEVSNDALSAARSFLFGSDPKLGAVAAQFLSSNSSDSSDNTLGKLYREEREASNYAPRDQSFESADKEPLVIACAKDARLNGMDSFPPEVQFEPAERLLMYDRFVFDGFDATKDRPVTAYVTDASLDDVVDHFTIVFGKAPFATVLESQTTLQNASLEITALQAALLSGDMNAIKKVQEIGDQMQEAQAALTIASLLQLQSVHAENDVYWADAAEGTSTQSPMPRAVSVGKDALLNKTVIRYFNGAINQDVNVPSGNGSTGSSDGDAGTTSSGGDGGTGNGSTGNGDAGTSPTPSANPNSASDAGKPATGGGNSTGSGKPSEPTTSTTTTKTECSCSLPGARTTMGGSWLLGIAAAAWLTRRRLSR